MRDYRGRRSGLLATIALCATLLGVACGEHVERVSRSHSNRDDAQLRLIPRAGKDEDAGSVAGAHRRVSAAVLVGEEDLSHHQQFHQSSEQRRRTQTCEESSPLSITSSLSADFEGCYLLSEVPAGDDDEIYTIYTPDGTPAVDQMWMFHGVEEINGVRSPGKWWLAFVTDVDDDAVLTGHFFCESGQSAALYPHPGDVTSWYCADGLVSAAELSATCGGGCAGSTTSTETEPEPSPVGTPEPTEAEESEPTDGSCDESSPVSVVSSFAPDLEGCYYPIAEVSFSYDSFGDVIYTPSGEPGVNQLWLHPGGVEGQEGVYWWLSFITDENSFGAGENYCVSGQSSESYHPTEVTSWYCESFDAPTPGVSITCGCSDSPSPDEPEISPTPQPAVETSEPTEAETPEPTDDPATPAPTETDSSDAAPVPTPEPSPATDEPSPTPEPSGSRGLDITSFPSAGSTDSPDDAFDVTASTPAPVGLSAGAGGASTARRCSAWSVSTTGGASVAAAVALAVAW